MRYNFLDNQPTSLQSFSLILIENCIISHASIVEGGGRDPVTTTNIAINLEHGNFALTILVYILILWASRVY